MSSMDSVTDFFYNVVPGIIFLLVLDSVYILPEQLRFEGAEKIFVLISLGLFLGFISQVIVKFLRIIFCFNEKYIFLPVKNDDRETFDVADKILHELNIIEEDEMDCNLTKKFHLMDNYLRSKPQSEIINHFASKAAFWSNIFVASLILILIDLFNLIPSKFNGENLVWVPSAFLLMSLLAAGHYWRIQYDVVMKTFLAIYKIDVKLHKV